MGITAALSNAVSGLRATSVQSDIVSRNISNANTEGYTRKDVSLETVGGNVGVASIDRQVSGLLERLDRGNISKLSGQQTVMEGVTAYTDYLGQPSDKTSPAALLSNLKSSMIGFSGSVDAGGAQLAVVSSAKEFASQMNRLSATIQTVESEVEMNIRYDVNDLNSSLYEVAKLNKEIFRAREGTVLHARLQDDMGRELEVIAGLVDVQASSSRNGMVSLLTSGGSELVRGVDVFDIEYDGMTGVLTAGGVNITPGGGNRSFSEGSLAGLFELKDEILPGFSGQLDAMAAAVVEGFERVAPITLDGRGLFTDAGGAYNATTIEGLASRIIVNSAADPDLGGSTAVIQNGSNAAVPLSDNSLALSMVALFNEPVVVPTAGLGAALSLMDMATTMTGTHQQKRVSAESATKATSAAAATISSSKLNLQGVNIDDELQKLMLVEQSYAANAKVLTTVNNMLDTLMNAVR
jgi:flagellar hook-associated protein 1 FlgK